MKSEDLHEVMNTLQQTCSALHLRDEIKWQKISVQYLTKYIELMDVFFKLIKEGKIKVRIMFLENVYKANHHQYMPKRDIFFNLYYRFISHAFGLRYSNNNGKQVFLRIYFDSLPYTLKEKQAFKKRIKELQTSSYFQHAGIKIRKQDVNEVDSKKHLLMQLLDVVLGAVCFYLNNKHTIMLQDNEQGSKRTGAKQKVFDHINKRIKEMKKGFSMGTSTAITSKQDHWTGHYRHWKFKPGALQADDYSAVAPKAVIPRRTS